MKFLLILLNKVKKLWSFFYKDLGAQENPLSDLIWKIKRDNVLDENLKYPYVSQTNLKFIKGLLLIPSW